MIMKEEKKQESTWQRYNLAIIILILSFLGIFILAILAILNERENAMTILNIALPVFASWVGTILAFYFGRENFESANTQIREIINKLSPEELEKQPVVNIMKKLTETTHFKMTGNDDTKVILKDIRKLYDDQVTRLPILNPDDSPKYLIHESSIDSYILLGKSENDTLSDFIANRKAAKKEFGLNKGFVVVCENSTVAEAKERMEQDKSCQDIIVTKNGTEKEPVKGWISNTRLQKVLQG
jgi:hypothetical protein